MMADKATHQRETRQLIGIITLNPGGENLLVPVFLGCPKCPKGDGEYLKDNIVAVIDHFIKSEQLVGFTGDGVYILCKVVEKLEKHYRTSFFKTWDEMHLAATVDTKLRKLKKFAWAVKITVVIGKGVKFVAWGREWWHFFNVGEELEKNEDFDFKMYRPAAFSETKFANSASIVYTKFRELFPALVITLEEVKQDFHNGNSTEKVKAEKADEVQSGIMNYLFCLSLSALVDIYRVYGAISNILQIINILPHERHDMFKNQLAKFREMKNSVDLEDCPCMMVVEGDEVKEDSKEILEEVCCWLALHADTRDMLKKGKYRGVVLGQLNMDPTNTREGRQQATQWLEEDRQSTANKVYRRAEEMVSYLMEGLGEKVYNDEAIIMMNHSRRLLNIESDLIKVKINGAANVSNLGWRGFMSAALFFEPAVFTRITEEEMRKQYREFNRRLEEISKKKETMGLSSKKILSLFFDPKMKMYVDIEGVLSVLARACVSKGVEAIVESWVSVMETHCSSVRWINLI